MSAVFGATIPEVEIKQGRKKRKVTTPILKLLLLAWADHANDDGEGMYPSQTTLEKKTGLAHSTVNAGIIAAKQAGYVSYVGISKKGTSEYKLDASKLVPWRDTIKTASTAGGLPVVPLEDYPSTAGGHESSLPIPEPSFTPFGNLVSEVNALPYCDYPDNVREMCFEFCKLYHFDAPNKPKGKSKSQFSFWIMSLTELVTASGEFGIDVLREHRRDFESYMQTHGGVAPFTISSPQSLVNVVRGKAAQMRAPISAEKTRLL